MADLETPTEYAERTAERFALGECDDARRDGGARAEIEMAAVCLRHALTFDKVPPRLLLRLALLLADEFLNKN